MNDYCLGIENNFDKMANEDDKLLKRFSGLYKIYIFSIEDDRFVDYMSERLVKRGDTVTPFKKGRDL